MAVRPTVTDADGFGKELLAASPDLLGSCVACRPRQPLPGSRLGQTATRPSSLRR